MTTQKKKSVTKQPPAKKPEFKEQDLTTKRNKTTAHNTPGKRTASKVRGR
jgi:hypothetical protein